MKSKLLLIAFTGLTTFTFAQYSTPNTGVDWTLDDIAADSPETVTVSGNEYTLHENLMVEAQDALSLNENLTLKVAPGVEIEVRGSFTSDADEITITAVDPENPYEGFWFFDTAEVYFRNTLIEYGGGLRVVTPNFEMDNCEVSNHVSGSATGGAISFSTGTPIVKNSTFKFNENPALSSGANASAAVWIEGNYFEGNNASNSNAPQINIGPSGDQDSTRVINNTVIGNRELTRVGGISVSSLIGGTNKFIIKGNTVKDNRYGITSSGGSSSGYISDNIIEDNDTEGAPMLGGSGINLVSTGLVYVTNNQIRRNLWGITLQGSALINLGSDDEEDYNPGGNVFSENGNEDQIYALFNNTPNEVKALHNCWIEGQESTFEDVESVISHVVDDATLGEVFFDPFECGVELGLEDLQKSTFTVYPNPAKNSFFIESKDSGNLSVYDLSGKKVLSKNNLSGKNQIQLNLTKGIYIVEFDNLKSKSTQKLIVE